MIITQSPAAGAMAGSGVTTITVTVKDAANNVSTCTTTFTVNDSTPPTITAPPPITVSTGTGATTCGVTISDATLGAASANDKGLSAVTITHSGVPASNFFPVSMTTITPTDASGVSAAATQTVNVEDTTPTAVSCPASMTITAAMCQVTIPNRLSGIIASDNCTPTVFLSIRQNPVAGTSVVLGVHTITVTVSDAAGESATCVTSITVANSPPANVSAGGPYICE